MRRGLSEAETVRPRARRSVMVVRDAALLDGVTSAVLTSYLVARTGSRLLTTTIRSVIEWRDALGGR